MDEPDLRAEARNIGEDPLEPGCPGVFRLPGVSRPAPDRAAGDPAEDAHRGRRLRAVLRNLDR